ncbi:MAG: hypothetical protein LWX11_06180 [Firmicutes bacterium]|nr:hypothetical protein [Bacillota bacterium]
MNWQIWIILALALVSAFFLLRPRKKSACASGCGGCESTSCADRKNS